MRNLFLTLTILFCFQISWGQEFNFSLEPTIGMSRTYYVLDSFAPAYDISVGTSTYWDYSTTGGIPNKTTQLTIEDPSTSEFGEDYPTSNKMMRIEGYYSTFLLNDTVKRKSLGFVVEDTDVGDVKTVFSNDAQILMRYPFGYDSLIMDGYLGNISFDFNGNPQSQSCYGQSVSHFDGKGSFVTPDGMTIENVSRWSLKDTTIAVIPQLGEIQMIHHQYEYYDFDNNDTLPIFIHSRATIYSGFPDPIMDEMRVLSKFPATATASLEENQNEFRLFPNPAKGSLTIHSENSTHRFVISDSFGRVILSDLSPNQQIDVTNVASGVYFIGMQNHSSRTLQRLIIE